MSARRPWLSFHRALPWILLVLVVSASIADAAEAVVTPIQAPSIPYSIFRVIGALALVFAILLGGVWLFRNWQRLTIQRGKIPKLNVLEVKSLGPRHALYVIGYEQQRFLLSSAPGGVSLLTVLPSSDETEAPVAAVAQPTFAEALARALSPKSAGGPK